MKLTILTAAAVFAASAALAQTPAPAGSSGSMPGTQPGGMPPTESMTRPGDAPGTAGSSTPGTTDSTASGAAMTEQAARQKLAGAGYGSVSNLKRNADGQWEAMTRSNGKAQRVTIAPDGSVTPNTK